MSELCPHCSQLSPDACNPEDSPECWEFHHLSASQHITAEVWVTKGEAVPTSAKAFLGKLDQIEREAS